MAGVIVAISTPIAGVDRTAFSRLVDLRRRELKDPGLKNMRHDYVSFVMEYAPKLLDAGLTDSDRVEADKEFRDAAERKFADLKRELRIAKKDVFLSKEGITCAVAAAGVMAGGAIVPALVGIGKAVGVGALLSTAEKYRRARAKALATNPMAWLFNARPRSRDLIRIVSR